MARGGGRQDAGIPRAARWRIGGSRGVAAPYPEGTRPGVVPVPPPPPVAEVCGPKLRRRWHCGIGQRRWRPGMTPGRDDLARGGEEA